VVGVVKVWNASQKQPLDSVRVHSAGVGAVTLSVFVGYFNRHKTYHTGITSIHFAMGSSRMICGSTDGTVMLYHMLKRQVARAVSTWIHSLLSLSPV
jgi:WD40 repeat protein